MDALSGGQVLPGGVLEVRTHNRKGRSLYTTRLVKGGETVLDEAPLLLLVAPETAQSTCIACLRAVRPQECIECSVCRQACFCSATCQQTAQGTPWLHSQPLCSAYARLAMFGLPPEQQSQLRFLLHALALRHAGTAEAGELGAGPQPLGKTPIGRHNQEKGQRRFAALSCLVGEATEAERAVAARLAPLLVEALRDLQGVGGSLPIPWDVEELARLLRKEQLNSYGVLAAPYQYQHHHHHHHHGGTAAPGPGCSGEGGNGQTAPKSSCGAGCSGGGSGGEAGDGERRLRGSALYAQASLINHECLPNVARFDDFDSDLPDRTHVTFRALHDLPPGTELAQSYVPLHWDLAERQAQCREVYGFACTCPRCQTESRWSDDDDDDEGEESEWETDSGGGNMEADGEDRGAPAAGGGEAAAMPGDGGVEIEMQEAQAGRPTSQQAGKQPALQRTKGEEARGPFGVEAFGEL
ncbi:hypothetical protein VOLCADRAFT_104220 [Volvox carteri f. nagariensis]|uniref:SET domain-containing protein n=1 Tax=Volvox carteri f. nagariensis TaxID=3068 RepID=D8TS63_VOLCA|nr:uncharacterized protein VOLCADRAFT_104220 [Volvox carteri f. nagariensis]EFJ49771.1 hypothetical protein VOLCADRAFT_104220 [Volvox carteri f. nagariensis]|eukprot:XP_002949278.1 hypothetical protein VOLCADRAFT_104220 [Volvox carteri f. nagariensis]